MFKTQNCTRNHAYALRRGRTRARRPSIYGVIVGSPEYWTVLYWCFVTLSTLGLGDYTPKTSRALSVVSFYVYVVGGISLLSLVVQYLQERALPRSVTGAKDPTAPTQSEGGIDRFQLSNAPEVAVTLERHSLSPYRLTLTDGL